MGVIPCGSGNDLAAVLRIPATPEGALDVLVCQTPKATDYLVCSGVRGLNVIGAGIDVEILRRSYRARFLRGKPELLCRPRRRAGAVPFLSLPI